MQNFQTLHKCVTVTHAQRELLHLQNWLICSNSCTAIDLDHQICKIATDSSSNLFKDSPGIPLISSVTPPRIFHLQIFFTRIWSGIFTTIPLRIASRDSSGDSSRLLHKFCQGFLQVGSPGILTRILLGFPPGLLPWIRPGILTGIIPGIKCSSKSSWNSSKDTTRRAFIDFFRYLYKNLCKTFNVKDLLLFRLFFKSILQSNSFTISSRKSH